MNVKDILTQGFFKTKVSFEKASPEIFMALGITAIIGGTIMACVATSKEKDIRNEAKEKLQEVRESKPKAEADTNVYSDNEPYGVIEQPSNESIRHYRKELFFAYAKGAGQYIKLYGPSIAVEVLGIACILKSHNIMKGRNVALAAAYTTLDTAFKGYRNRVAEKFGDEVEKEIRYNLKKESVMEETVTEDGKKKKVKKDILVSDDALPEYSPYARFFDESSIYWDKDATINLQRVYDEQAFANKKLKLRGYLFLNEVYERLGIPITEAGQNVGWIYDEKNPLGDNYVDFGLFDQGRPANRRFVNGYEPVILLDFNVDGCITQRLWPKKTPIERK